MNDFCDLGARSAALALFVLGLSACQGEKPNPIHVSLGSNDSHSFVPKTVLAESLVVPGVRNELRLLLAEGDASCDRHIEPEEGEVLVTVTVFAPPNLAIGPGTYPWVRPPVAPEGKPAPVLVHAVPKVHLLNESHLLEPGGGIQLKAVDLQPNGAVQGELAFEFPGDGKASATHLQGRFKAKICQPTGRNPQ